MRNQYDTPRDFGIPNPYGPRLHNWKGGPLNEGSLFHGPVYTRPAYTLPRVATPLFGLGNSPEERDSTTAILLLGAAAIFMVAVINAAVPLPRR